MGLWGRTRTRRYSDGFLPSRQRGCIRFSAFRAGCKVLPRFLEHGRIKIAILFDDFLANFVVAVVIVVVVIVVIEASAIVGWWISGFSVRDETAGRNS